MGDADIDIVRSRRCRDAWRLRNRHLRDTAGSEESMLPYNHANHAYGCLIDIEEAVEVCTGRNHRTAQDYISKEVRGDSPEKELPVTTEVKPVVVTESTLDDPGSDRSSCESSGFARGLREGSCSTNSTIEVALVERHQA